MEIFTIIKTTYTDYGCIELNTEVLGAIDNIEKAKQIHKKVVFDFIFDNLFNDNEEFQKECLTDERMKDINNVYNFYLSENEMWWGIQEWGFIINIEIITSTI